MRKNQKSGDKSIQIAGNVQGNSTINTAGAVQIVIQQQALQNQPPEAETKRNTATAQEVVDILESMTREDRAAVLEFVYKNMGVDLFKGLTAWDLYRVKRYAETVIERK